MHYAPPQDLGNNQLIAPGIAVTSWRRGAMVDISFPIQDGITPNDPAQIRPHVWSTNQVKQTAQEGEGTISYAGLSEGEESYLFSPLFDITNLRRPVVEFDIVYNFAADFNGASFQYTVDDGENWITLGDYNANIIGGISSGHNWYTSREIRSRPGDNPLGWNNFTNSRQWETARHVLDGIPIGSRERVQFRFAVRLSNGSTQVQGIAIDNFRIRSRNRITLVEEFVSELNPESKTEDERVSEVIGLGAGGTNQFVINALDAVRISYYGYTVDQTSREGAVIEDRLYRVNDKEVNARQIYYGVDDVPTTILQGGVPYTPELANAQADQTQLFLHALRAPEVSFSFASTDPEITIGADDLLELEVSVTLTQEAIDNGLGDRLVDQQSNNRLFIVVIERNVVMQGHNSQILFHDVMRKMLPDAAGTPILFRSETGSVPPSEGCMAIITSICQ